MSFRHRQRVHRPFGPAGPAAVLLIALTGCATAPAPPPEPPPPRRAITPDRFRPVPEYQALPNPASTAERAVLARLAQELALLQGLAREAQDRRNPGARRQFRYDLLLRDLDAVRHGVRQHLQAPLR